VNGNLLKRFGISFGILWQILCLGAMAVFIGACGPVLMPFDANMPAQGFAYLGAPPVADAREQFRPLFCALLESRRQELGLDTRCDDYLWHLPDEKRAAAGRKSLPVHRPDMTILIVPGAFSDCFGQIGTPYQEAVQLLRQTGYRIEYVEISGMSSSRHNAEIIANAVAEQETLPPQPLVLVGYSKGTTDILHFLVDYPSLARRVRAVVSIAGAVNGSALADRYYATHYDNWLTGLTPGKCRPGDGGVLDSLSRVRQLQWLATHPLPEHIRYYSVATFARYEDIQTYLRGTYKMLEKINPLNDGQLIFYDQLIPGSALLGYVNADHWTVAVPVEETFSGREKAVQEKDRKLRSLLFESLVLFVGENVSSPQ